jgi:hypothetical protein
VGFLSFVGDRFAAAVEGAIFEHQNSDMLDPRQSDSDQDGTALSTAPDCCGSAVTLLSRSAAIG